MMPVSNQMNMSWYMGGIEWLELVLFWAIAIVVLTVLIISLIRQPVLRIRAVISDSS